MASKIPEAYQRGHVDFYGREFKVTPDVLIPRPETEQIIDQVLILAGKPYLPGVKSTKNQLQDNPVILDVGTGSGCIAITIKKELPNAIVIASDISKKALNLAKINAARQNVRINFIESNLLTKIDQKPDVIVANLPYVDPGWDWLDKEVLSYEPSLALYAKDHGLELIKKLIKEAAEKTVKFIILESDPCQHEEITRFSKENKYIPFDKRGYILTFTR